MEQNKCYSSNDENYEDDLSSVIDEILSNSMTIEDAIDSTISVGDAVRPNIKGNHLADWLVERVSEDLYEEVGEYSENYECSSKDYEELKLFLTEWIDKQDFKCWSVENTKDLPITDFIETAEIVEYFKECGECGK